MIVRLFIHFFHLLLHTPIHILRIPHIQLYRLPSYEIYGGTREGVVDDNVVEGSAGHFSRCHR